MLARFGPHADFLDLALMGVSLAQPFLLLVLELPIIHDAANGRSLIGRDFDEIKICFSSLGQGLVGADDSEQFAVGGNDSDG